MQYPSEDELQEWVPQIGSALCPIISLRLSKDRRAFREGPPIQDLPSLIQHRIETGILRHVSRSSSGKQLRDILEQLNKTSFRAEQAIFFNEEYNLSKTLAVECISWTVRLFMSNRLRGDAQSIVEEEENPVFEQFLERVNALVYERWMQGEL